MKNDLPFDGYQLIDNRQVRIFLSSTFRDMEEERSALIKTFEILRLKANRRDVDLCVVDLRWGVTEEESRNGKTISVCLNEIERSYPFFIGLLGNHYGTAIDSSILEMNPDLKERYPWLVDDIAAGLSITEIEMRYGVLCNEGNSEAFFYLKQTSEPDDDPRLSELKRKIRQQQRCPVADYASIDELCNKIEVEVVRVLDRYYPETDSSPIGCERTMQRAYINSRHAHYFKRQSYFDIIDSFVLSQEHHLVFNGESGVGKSALLANWVKENENRDEFNLVYHFVGNSFSDNNYENILRRLCDEIYNLYPIERQSNHFDTIEEEAQHLLNLITIQKKPLVIVIDGINQIVTINNEKLLLWLPVSNEKVKYIFSTLDDDETMDVFQQRGCRVETVAPLSSKERERFAAEYLDSFGKRLSENLLQRIINDAESENTLVLKSLLDELICFGSYERLESRIDYYLSATSIPDFFDRVLIRMEEDYSANQDLVRHILTLISVSERGLSEEEIMAIVGCQERDWKLFFCAFYNHFIVKDGIISFSHQYMASAIEKRYHTTDASQIASFRHETVSYFESIKKENTLTSNRCISELAHQYYHLADWKGLYKTLLSFDAFNYFNGSNQPLFGLYWRSLINTRKRFSLSAYMKLSYREDLPEISFIFYNIAFFIQDYIPDYKMALRYYFKALEIRKKTFGKGSAEIAELYNNISIVYAYEEDYPSALEYGKKALRIYEKALENNNPDKAAVYNNIGGIYDSLNKQKLALKYYLLALKIFEQVLGKEHPDTAVTYNNIGYVYDNKCDFKKALEYYNLALKANEHALGRNHPNTATSFNNIGALYDKTGDWETALGYYTKALTVYEKALGTKHPLTAVMYNNIGIVYESEGLYNKALEYYVKGLEINLAIFGLKNTSTASTFDNMGSAYYKLEDYSKAHDCFQKSLGIKEKTLDKKHHDIAASYSNIGMVYHAQGDFSTALEYYFKALEIMEKALGKKHPDTATIYENIGGIYNDQGFYNNALDYFLKALKIMEKVFGENNHDVAMLYNNIGDVCDNLGLYEKAIEVFGKALEILDKTVGYYHPSTATVLNNIGTIYYEQEKYNEAMEYYGNALEIRIKVLGSDHPDTMAAQENINEVERSIVE